MRLLHPRLPRWMHRRHRWRSTMEIRNGVVITRKWCRVCDAEQIVNYLV